MTKEEKKKILNEMPSNYELGSNLENSIHLIQERIFMLNKRLDTIEILLWFISVVALSFIAGGIFVFISNLIIE